MKKALAAGTSDDGAALASPSRGPRPTTRDARANHATDTSTQTSPKKFTIEFSGAGAAASALGALAASQPKSSSRTLCQPVESVAKCYFCIRRVRRVGRTMAPVADRSGKLRVRYLQPENSWREAATPPHSNARAHTPRSAARTTMSGISSSNTAAAPLSPPPEPPMAEGHGGGTADADDDDNNSFSPLLDLLERFPYLFAQKVLQHLNPIAAPFSRRRGARAGRR